MSVACQLKLEHGPQFCVADCPVTVPSGVFFYKRIESPQDLPAADERIIDIAVLDMNHGWANLGHDSLVHLVKDASCDILSALYAAGLAVRVLSYDVRRTGMIPERPGSRFMLYLGTGGPGNIVPQSNDGISEGSQGIQENPDWEQPVFRLLDAIKADNKAVLLGVCHTFGVLCRWSGIAQPRLRGEAKGGKSTGVLENILTPEARQHPWFKHFAAQLPDGWRLRIMDNRLYDLLPRGPLPQDLTVIGYETISVGGARGDSLTMVEWMRDSGGIMPRIFAVNHHPEIVDRSRQLMILQQKQARGEVTAEWYDERLDILTHNYPYEDSEQLLSLTSDFTLIAPLRFYLLREIRHRAASLGLSIPLHEEQILQKYIAP